jgi:hypothetical protein
MAALEEWGGGWRTVKTPSWCEDKKAMAHKKIRGYGVFVKRREKEETGLKTDAYWEAQQWRLPSAGLQLTWCRLLGGCGSIYTVGITPVASEPARKHGGMRLAGCYS